MESNIPSQFSPVESDVPSQFVSDASQVPSQFSPLDSNIPSGSPVVSSIESMWESDISMQPSQITSESPNLSNQYSNMESGLLSQTPLDLESGIPSGFGSPVDSQLPSQVSAEPSGEFSWGGSQLPSGLLSVDPSAGFSMVPPASPTLETFSQSPTMSRPPCPCVTKFTQATYNENFSIIYLFFDGPISKFKESPCLDFLRPFTIREIGQDSRCLRLNSTTIAVYPTIFPPLKTLFELRDDAVFCPPPSNDKSCTLSSIIGSQLLSSPYTFRFRVRLSAPNFGDCAPLVLNATIMLGNEIPASYAWNFQLSSEPADWEQTLSRFISRQKSSVITILPSQPIYRQIPRQFPLPVRVDVSNFLGKTAFATAAPSKILIVDPVVNFMVANMSKIHPYVENILSIDAQTILCNGTLVPTFVDWSVIAQTDDESLNLNFTISSIPRHAITFPANSLRALVGTVLKIIVLATSPSVGGSTTTALHLLIQPSPFSVQILPCYSLISSQTTQNFTSAIQDPDSNSASHFSFWWGCETITPTGECPLPISNMPYYTITNHTLSSGKYRILLNASHQDAQASSECVFDVVERPVLYITLHPKSMLTNLNPLHQFVIVATASLSPDPNGETVSGVTFQWQLAMGGQSLENTGVIFSPSGDVMRIMPATLVSGGIYDISVMANSSDGLSGISRISLHVSSPPYGGTVNVDPLYGHALVTSFTIMTDNWQGNMESRPFLYELGYHMNGEKTILAESYKNWARMLLPPGNITIYGKATNKFGCASETRLDILVDPPHSLDAAMSNVMGMFQTEGGFKDSEQQIMYTNLVLDMLDYMTRSRRSNMGTQTIDEILIMLCHSSLNMTSTTLPTSAIVWSGSKLLSRTMKLITNIDHSLCQDISTYANWVVAGMEAIYASQGSIRAETVANMLDALYRMIYKSQELQAPEVIIPAGFSTQRVQSSFLETAITLLQRVQEIQLATKACGSPEERYQIGGVLSYMTAVPDSSLQMQSGSMRIEQSGFTLPMGSCMRGAVIQVQNSLLQNSNVMHSELIFAMDVSVMSVMMYDSDAGLPIHTSENSTYVFDLEPLQSNSTHALNYECAGWRFASGGWDSSLCATIDDNYDRTRRTPIYCECTPLFLVAPHIRMIVTESSNTIQESRTQSESGVRSSAVNPSVSNIPQSAEGKPESYSRSRSRSTFRSALRSRSRARDLTPQPRSNRPAQSNPVGGGGGGAPDGSAQSQGSSGAKASSMDTIVIASASGGTVVIVAVAVYFFRRRRATNVVSPREHLTTYQRRASRALSRSSSVSTIFVDENRRDFNFAIDPIPEET
eukprot:TRINITY_DN3182_c0_g1_i6.p1 TRINITY_DN3182_c0_g1~~TRINITY_DN3182_c0_g1_i6.p1  ORF type:complete len:1315 (-),score=172.13 TRINITY_DN3182_c0_g1_i6:135-4079(-)